MLATRLWDYDLWNYRTPPLLSTALQDSLDGIRQGHSLKFTECDDGTSKFSVIFDIPGFGSEHTNVSVSKNHVFLECSRNDEGTERKLKLQQTIGRNITIVADSVEAKCEYGQVHITGTIDSGERRIPVKLLTK